MEPEEERKLQECAKQESKCTADLDQYVAPIAHNNTCSVPLMSKSFPMAEHSNRFISVQPGCLIFHSYKIGRPITRLLHVINISGKEQRFHILPLERGSFSLQYEKKRKLLPGTELPVKITFLPEAYTPLWQNLYIHCPYENNLTIPLTASPSPTLSGFPSTLHFPNTAINSCNTLQFDLVSDLFIPFAFQLQFRPPTESMSVIPTSGTVSPEGCTSVCVYFKPNSLKTTMADLELTLPDINSNIRICSCSGSCLPLAKTAPPKDMQASVTQTKHRIVLVKHNNVVSKIRTKSSSKLNPKINPLDKIAPATLHVLREREREFLNDVQFLKEKEKMNQLRCSTALGDADLPRGSPSHVMSELEFGSSSRQLQSSTEREAIKVERSSQGHISDPESMIYDTFFQASINWQERRECLHRLLVVAKRVVIQIRAQNRLERILNFLKKAQDAGLTPYEYETKQESLESFEEDFVLPEFTIPSVPYFFPREDSIKVGFDVNKYPFIDIPPPSIDFIEEEPYFDTIAPLYHEQQDYPKFPLFCPNTAYLQPLIGKKKIPMSEYKSVVEEAMKKEAEESKKSGEQAELAPIEHPDDGEEGRSIRNHMDRNTDNEAFTPLDIPLKLQKINMQSEDVEISEETVH